MFLAQHGYVLHQYYRSHRPSNIFFQSEIFKNLDFFSQKYPFWPPKYKKVIKMKYFVNTISILHNIYKFGPWICKTQLQRPLYMKIPKFHKIWPKRANLGHFRQLDRLPTFRNGFLVKFYIRLSSQTFAPSKVERKKILSLSNVSLLVVERYCKCNIVTNVLSISDLKHTIIATLFWTFSLQHCCKHSHHSFVFHPCVIVACCKLRCWFLSSLGEVNKKTYWRRSEKRWKSIKYSTVIQHVEIYMIAPDTLP